MDAVCDDGSELATQEGVNVARQIQYELETPTDPDWLTRHDEEIRALEQMRIGKEFICLGLWEHRMSGVLSIREQEANDGI